MREQDFAAREHSARNNGLGTGQRMPSVCTICGFTRTDRRHGKGCSRKAQQMFSELNRPKWRRKSAAAIDRLLNTVEEYRESTD